MDPGGRICQRAIFACIRFCPASMMFCTHAIAAFTFRWIRSPATMFPTTKASTPKNVLQP